MAFDWRRLNRALHRDLGYLAIGVTLLYAVSGVLLNHLHTWKPNWKFERVSLRVTPFPDPPAFAEKDVPGLLQELGEREKPTGLFRPTSTTARLFFDGGRVVEVDLATGQAEGEVARLRPVAARLNALHLNRGGKAWTVLADLSALLLAFLAVSGAFVLRGRMGLAGRGGWLTLAGFLVPLLFLLLLRL